MVAVGRDEIRLGRAVKDGIIASAGFEIEEQIRARQLARLRRNFPAQRQPVARRKAAVLARGIARIIRRDRILFLAGPCV